MRLICPNCVAQYEVDDDVIPPEGRDVQCANCQHNWFQDSVQMLATTTDTPSTAPETSTGSEIFEDLDGKVEAQFVSTRAQSAPNPNDMEPETASDDFQIEQRPTKPSEKLDRNALDILRQEAELSNRGKSPTTVSTPPKPRETETQANSPESVAAVTEPNKTDNIDSKNPETPSMAEQAATEAIVDKVASPEQAEIPNKSPQTPTADEIRKRIQELESREEFKEEPVEPVKSDTKDINTAQTNEQQKYKEHIPQESDAANKTPDQESIEREIDQLVAENDVQQEHKTTDRPVSNRVDMLPAIDDVSTEIAQERSSSASEQATASKNKPQKKRGFLRGFLFAILLCVLAALIYLFRPQIIEYLPQSENTLNYISGYVNQLINYAKPYIEQIKGLL